MLTLPNGYSFDFCCASGALGFDGRGYWWEQPLRWVGLLRPAEMLIIAKTVTLEPRAGNLKMWCPWRCVRLIPGGAVNAVGLTNPGLECWVERLAPRALRRGYPLAASIMPVTPQEAVTMAWRLNTLDLKAVEVNLSCPNSQDLYDPAAVLKKVKEFSRHPVIAKLGADTVGLIPELEQYADAFDLINTIPWYNMHPGQPSPLVRYGLAGGVSGRQIRGVARDSLVVAKRLTNKPVISGGGVDSYDEANLRFDLGASAVSFGTVFLRAPWRPNRIVAQYRREYS